MRMRRNRAISNLQSPQKAGVAVEKKQGVGKLYQPIFPCLRGSKQENDFMVFQIIFFSLNSLLEVTSISSISLHSTVLI